MNEAAKSEETLPEKWVAKVATFLKTSHLPARDLPENDKQAVAKDAVLVARLMGWRHEFFLVADGFIDGVAVDPRFKFAHGGHWTPVAPEPPKVKAVKKAAVKAKVADGVPRIDPRKVKRQSRKKV